jgi:Spy/CpxP family protein refolding chaperone
MTKQRWMWLALGLSIAFNAAFLCALGVQLKMKHKRHAAWIERMEHFDGPPPPFPGRPPGADSTAPRPEPGELRFRTEQRDHLWHIRERFLPEMKATHEKLFQKRQELTGLITSEKPDTAAINRKLDEIGTLQILIEKGVVRQMLKERDLMDPEQREHFREGILRQMKDRDQFRHLRRFENEPNPEKQKTVERHKENAP